MHADLGSRSGARRDGLPNRSVPTPEAGADDRPALANPSIDLPDSNIRADRR